MPVHAALTEVGFLDYLAKRKRSAAPGDLLFPGFDLNGADKRSTSWSKWFGRYLRRKVGIKDPRKVFHSFRHTFKDACREAGVPEDHHDQITSHSSRGRNVGRGYGRGIPLATINISLQRVRYPGVDLPRLLKMRAGE